MSHLKERNERNCLNCNAVVNGRYCSVCGQENLEPQEGVGHLISHFFNDITHFDGKFFSSLKYLIIKPGFLSEEYMLGRRASYLNPVRMYIFTSFIFFLVFFSVTVVGNESEEEAVAAAHVKAQNKDSLETAEALKKISPANRTVRPGNEKYELDLGTDSIRYRSVEEYDSLIKAGEIKDGFFRRYFTRKSFYLKKKYGKGNLVQEKLVEIMQHYIPQMLFLSLPLFALFLKLLYIRRKKFYYVAHGIFTIHFYVFIYIAGLVLIGLDELNDWLKGSEIIDWIMILVGLSIFYYGYKAMRNFYGQKRFKTILKYLLLMIWLLFIVSLLSALLFFISIYKL